MKGFVVICSYLVVFSIKIVKEERFLSDLRKEEGGSLGV